MCLAGAVSHTGSCRGSERRLEKSRETETGIEPLRPRLDTQSHTLPGLLPFPRVDRWAKKLQAACVMLNDAVTPALPDTGAHDKQRRGHSHPHATEVATETWQVPHSGTRSQGSCSQGFTPPPPHSTKLCRKSTRSGPP